MSSWKDKWDSSPPFAYYAGEYDDLVAEAGDVLVSATIGDYQGDFLYVFKSHMGYGFLVVGYGSCSGCDMLQACETLDEVEQLRVDLFDSIKWFDTVNELTDYVLNKERELNWYGYEEGWEEFKESVKAL